ncbi:hypothetical protein [Paracoccus yeei]|uniref:Uncharacterized protein n=1 Tax=Paracoccus yeei TaxID=147645 RepID=A0A2D2BYI3_9RHOB|nr:hypothetical protein [Paracoccus yeei]ATQ55335.1 hypothetical protein PYTT13_05585 [Paracoccus yeei]
MTDNVTKLPSAAVSYYTVNKRGKGWAVTLVTPIEGMKPIRTALYACADRDAAIAHGKQVAARMLRPFKESRA